MLNVFRGERNRLAALFLVLGLVVLIAQPLPAAQAKAGPPAKQSSAASKAQAKQDPALIGSWSTPQLLGVVGIHAALLHTGKVLFWWYPLGTATNSPAKLYDYKTGTITDATIPFAGDFFCSGMSTLADGRLLVIGGLDGNPFPGVPDKGISLTAIFDPDTETWTPGAAMNFARWYPAAVELNNGTILAATGKNATATAIVQQMEELNLNSNTWTTLPSSANVSPYSDTYLKLRLTTTGKVFSAGANAQTLLFSPATNRWVTTGKMNFGTRYHGVATLLPGLNKVFTSGGTQTYPGGGSTATSEVIDLSQPNPTWTYAAPMNFPRYNANQVLLADGTLLEVGGNQISKYLTPVTTPELYDPVADTWTEMEVEPNPRTYHSTAILLPDGTVIVAGSDDPANVDAGQEYEIFSPPYLFKGARPTITSAPTSITYNQRFAIKTPDTSSITRVAMIRPGATTHDDDFDQRYVDLTFKVSGGQIVALSPLNGNYAPPGWYMLVIVNSSGVPSVMPFLQIQ
jgi:Galactose oxidase-like, Early set domain